MRRVQRLLVTAAALAGVLAAILVVTYAGTASRGPLADVLARVGTAVSGVESSVVRRVRGPGRAADLEWFAPYRRSAARLRAPDHVLLGAYDGAVTRSLEGIIRLEDAVRTRFPLIHVYTAWGDRPEHHFPLRVTQAIRELGSVPVITWEPWLATFDEQPQRGLPPAAERDRGGLKAVASGSYDSYVDAWAAAAAAYGAPLFVRFAHEMNDPYRYPWGPHNNSPEDFRAAWRHVVGRFRAAGADNVVWVWSPHLAYPDHETFYPGDDVVDWTATGALNYGTVAYWSRWWTFDEIFGQKYERLAAFGHPIMLAELGTLAAGGERGPWLRDALTDLPLRLPMVKAVIFFHTDYDATVTQQALDWSFADDPVLAGIVAGAIRPWAAPLR